jgi:ABC-type transport system involved in cytochrome c biogenesis permease subunit
VTESEKVIVGGLLSALALLVPVFLFHVAPRFPGSLAGGLFGTAAALLFLLLLLYSAIKRLPWVKERTKAFISIGAVLAFHVYAGTVGALLALIHTGHKFQSPLGIVLTLAMLAVVASGFVGRYYLAHIGRDLREQQKELGVLRTRYDGLARVAAGLKDQVVVDPAGIPLGQLLGGMSDLEFEITAREALKNTLARWVVVHVVASIVMYALLVLHIWSGIYYGLRWLA